MKLLPLVLALLLVLTACKPRAQAGAEAAGGTLVTVPAGTTGDSAPFTLAAGNYEFGFGNRGDAPISSLDRCPVSIDLRAVRGDTETRLYQSVDGTDITKVKVNGLPAGQYVVTVTAGDAKCVPAVTVVRG